MNKRQRKAFEEHVAMLMEQGIPRNRAEEMAAIELDLSAGDIVDTGPDGRPLLVEEQKRVLGWDNERS